MVTVSIKASGPLMEYLKPDADPYTRRVEARDGETLRRILESIGVPPGRVAAVSANGNLVALDYVPSNGDAITLVPPVQGG
jgi:sulfur carrier protein ThiS